MKLLFVSIIGAVLGLSSGAGVFLNQDVAVGDDAQFLTSLTPTETPLTSITWTFGAKEMISYGDSNYTAPGYEGRIKLSISTGEMELRNVTINDSGQYNVTIVKADDERITELSTLAVWEVISNAEVASSTQLTEEGTSLNLTCDSSGSISNREWLKSGLPLQSSENIVFYHEKQVLSFINLSRTDSGRYSCSISNPVSSHKATYYMVVAYGPDKAEISGPKEVQVQTFLKLSCFAESVPAASYIWIKNETTVAASFEYIKNTSESSDGGDYICQATNDITLSTSQASHTVLITEPPKDTLSGGAIAGITIACLVVVVGAAVGGFFIYKHLCKQQNRVDRPTPNAQISNPSNTPRARNHYTNDPIYENPEPVYHRKL